MKSKVIRTSASTYREIVACVNNGKKIQAIKLLRRETGLGLKEAKYGIDRMCDPSLSDYPLVTAMPHVLAVTLDFGDGPLQLDIENMQLNMLTKLPHLGLQACAEMLELVDVFNALNDGKKIRIIGEEGEGR